MPSFGEIVGEQMVTPKDEVDLKPIEEPESPTEAPSKTEEPEPEIDWAVRGPELTAEVEKLSHTISTERGSRRSDQTQSDRLNRMEDSLSGIRTEVSRFMSHATKDDPELRGELDKGRQEDSREKIGRASCRERV